MPKKNPNLQIGSIVDVGEPEKDDLHLNAFRGTVVSLRNETVVVVDQEGDIFEVSEKNVTEV